MPVEGYDYVLVDENGREVEVGEQITDRLGFQMYLRGYNDRFVYVAKNPDYPLLISMGFHPDVYNLHIEAVTLPRQET
jgi:hypothetical protein